MRFVSSRLGFSLVELIITITIVAILAGLALPLARNSILRQREVELRRGLREMRVAIDRYKEASDLGLIQVTLGTEGYPDSLDILVEGVDQIGQVDRKLKFLRRIPIDPMTNSTGEDFQHQNQTTKGLNPRSGF